MRKIISFIKLLISGLLALIILSIFVFFYDYSGVHIKNTTGSTDYKWENNQLKTNMTEGYSFLIFDSNGYNNISIPQEIDVLVMGSSHMEAVNVDKNNNTVALMNNMYPDFTFYNIGISGHNIYHCANNIENAVNEYAPQKYLIIETDTVLLDGEQVNDVLNNSFQRIQSYDSGIVYNLQKYCPSIKCIYKNMIDWKNIENNANTNNQSEQAKHIDNLTLNRFLNKMRTDCGDCRLIIFYHPITKINSDGLLIDESMGVDEFRKACEANDIIFVDMTEDFSRFYDEYHILAHGFSNTAVGVGHLNSYGHHLIASRLVYTIEEDQKREP